MLGQVNALDFGGWGRTLKIGETYARALQMRLGYADYEKKADEIAKRLVYGYTHHPYFIDYDEAKDIGFNVSLMSKDAYGAALSIVEACEGCRFVGFIQDVQRREAALSIIDTPQADVKPPRDDREDLARALAERAPVAFVPGGASNPNEPPEPDQPAAHLQEQPQRTPGPQGPSVREAFPLLECDDVVVVQTPFDVRVGLASQPDPGVVGTTSIRLPATDVDLDVVLTYDPESLELLSPVRHTLHVTAAVSYPEVTVSFRARAGIDLEDARRIGVHYLMGGRLVGLAWRTLTVVQSAKDVAGAPRPTQRERQLVDLAAVLSEQTPDLILAIHQSDATASGSYVWSAYPLDAEVTVPGVARARTLGNDVRDFATNTRRTVQQGGDADATFRWLVGSGAQIGKVIPEGITKAIRTVAQSPGRTSPATILLFTEEVHVPWELAVFKPRLRTSFGAGSPFLGAHVDIGRWLLTESKPRPIPRPVVEVRDKAVVSARYEGVPRWGRLPSAEQEATEFARNNAPAAVVPPLFRDVIACLEGNPPADLLHMALHGQVDPQGNDEGLVLLSPLADGKYAAQYLQAQHIEGLELPNAPFVFLNACQVGAGKQVLGDYAGLAAAFLHAGAAAVVAPIWNDDDKVASDIAREFYRRTLADDPETVSEVLRDIRSRYQAASADPAAPPSSPTLIGYQLFGHPGFHLRRLPVGTPPR
jgi:hypothetical protein